MTTYAGSGVMGYLDGTVSAAYFQYPNGMAVDTLSNVYVADTNNHRIRKISSGGFVTTFVGSGAAWFADGVGTAAAINNPYNIAIDLLSNMYLADSNNQRIRKISPTGSES